MPTNGGTLEGPETSVLVYSTRQIQICRFYFCLDGIWKVILETTIKGFIAQEGVTYHKVAPRPQKRLELV